MTDEWMAGFFDGEGWISIVKTSPKNMTSPRYLLEVGLGNTHEQTMRFVQDHAGFGHLVSYKVKYPGAKRMWKWGAYSENACKFLETLLPHLHVKTEQAVIALAFQVLLRKQRKGLNKKAGLTDEQLAAREYFRQALKEAKG